MNKTAPQTRRKVCLLGARLHVGNLGCRALTVSLIAGIRRASPDAKISLLYGNEHGGPVELNIDGEMVTVRVENRRLSPRARFHEHMLTITLMAIVYRLLPVAFVRRGIRNRIPWIKAMTEADMIAQIHGGDSFSDIYGVARLAAEALENAIVSILGKRYVLLPQTYGPFLTKRSRGFAQYIFSRAAAVFARDAESLEVARSYLGDEKADRILAFCPDVAFTLPPAEPISASIEPQLPAPGSAPIIGLNINGLLYFRGNSGDPTFGMQGAYDATIELLIEQLLEKTDARLVLVPHDVGRGRNCDARATEDVWNALSASQRERVHRLVGEYDQSEVKHVIKGCDFFVGSRMHACIAALSQGVPAIGIAFSRKFEGVFETAGVPEMVADARALTPEDLVAQCISQYAERQAVRAHLESRVPALRAQIARMFEGLLADGSVESPVPHAAPESAEAYSND